MSPENDSLFEAVRQKVDHVIATRPQLIRDLVLVMTALTRILRRGPGLQVLINCERKLAGFEYRVVIQNSHRFDTRFVGCGSSIVAAMTGSVLKALESGKVDENVKR